jgi:hypothetical protein
MMRSTFLLFLALAVSAFGQAFPGVAAYQAAFFKPAAGGGGIVTNIWATSITGGSIGSGTTTNGIKFTVGASDIVVTDLGTYFTAGTYADTSVELTDSSCNRLAIAVVSASGSTPGADNWAPTLSPSVTLTAGATYHLKRNSINFNEYLQSATHTTTAAASLVSGTSQDCSDPGFTASCNFKYYIP